MGLKFKIIAFSSSLLLLGFLVILISSFIPQSTNKAYFSEDDFEIEIITKKIQVPWSIAFSNDGRIFFTERIGNVRIIENGVLKEEPWLRLNVSGGEGGLLGIALDPNFEENRFVYIYYTYSKGGKIYNRVDRYLDLGGKGIFNLTIVDEIPGALIHDGGRIKFIDGKLYITTGDANQPELAQDINSKAGKILRVNPDGSIPSDNPFANSPVYSYGHRNVQGIALNPFNNKIYATEHGPSGIFPYCCHDEINLIEAGGNYGWPHVYGIAKDSRFKDPLIESGSETWAPSGATFITKGPLKGYFVFATLRGAALHFIYFNPPDYTEASQHIVLFKGVFGRLRDVVEGPDGNLYVLTSNRDGRGSPTPDDDRIIKLKFKKQNLGVILHHEIPENLSYLACINILQNENSNQHFYSVYIKNALRAVKGNLDERER